MTNDDRHKREVTVEVSGEDRKVEILGREEKQKEKKGVTQIGGRRVGPVEIHTKRGKQQ